MTGMLLVPAVLFGFLAFALVPVADQRDGRAARGTRVLGAVLFILMIGAIIYAAIAPP